jgi:hypothetical protein
MKILETAILSSTGQLSDLDQDAGLYRGTPEKYGESIN